MPQFKNKEEYEKWKQERSDVATKGTPSTITVKGKRRGILSWPIKIFLCLAALTFILIVVFAARQPVLKGQKLLDSPPTTQENKLLPKFKVVGREITSLVILVPQNTSNEELKTLINEFRNARRGNYLNKMIPPTTRGGSAGNYGVVWLFVFSDERWASSENVRTYINGKNVDKELIKRIRAEYYFASSGTEYGNLGCRDEKDSSPEYEVIF